MKKIAVLLSFLICFVMLPVTPVEAAPNSAFTRCVKQAKKIKGAFKRNRAIKACRGLK